MDLHHIIYLLIAVTDRGYKIENHKFILAMTKYPKAVMVKANTKEHILRIHLMTDGGYKIENHKEVHFGNDKVPKSSNGQSKHKRTYS